MRFLLLLSLTACASAQMVQTARPNLSTDAPTNELERIGLIRFRLKGNTDKRRRDAYRQMRESCSGPYRIVSEGEGESGAVGYLAAHGSAATMLSTPRRYWYISYRCE